MARIAFCWELGRGFGHIVRYRTLIRRLVARGDDVFFLARHKPRVEQVFSDLPVEVIEIEPGFTAPSDRIRGADSYPDILYNCGFNDADALHGRMNRLAALIRKIAPDVLIADFAPTLMLANVALGLPLVSSGDGFGVPVRSTPMPRFRYWQGAAGETLRCNEVRVLDIVNRALSHSGLPPLNAVADFLEAAHEWLITFAELDFYGRREGAHYLGSFPSEQFGQPPVWPESGHPKIFAYLDRGPMFAPTMQALSEQGAAVCLYANPLSPAEKELIDPRRIHLATEPVDIAAVGREAAFFVNNGNLNTIAAALLAGKAQLALPTTAERYLNARRLELLGAGLAVPQAHSGDIPAKLHALLADTRYTRAAARFAEKYRASSSAEQTGTMLDDIDRLLQR